MQKKKDIVVAALKSAFPYTVEVAQGRVTESLTSPPSRDKHLPASLVLRLPKLPFNNLL